MMNLVMILNLNLTTLQHQHPQHHLHLHQLQLLKMQLLITDLKGAKMDLEPMEPMMPMVMKQTVNQIKLEIKENNYLMMLIKKLKIDWKNHKKFNILHLPLLKKPLKKLKLTLKPLLIKLLLMLMPLPQRLLLKPNVMLMLKLLDSMEVLKVVMVLEEKEILHGLLLPLMFLDQEKIKI